MNRKISYRVMTSEDIHQVHHVEEETFQHPWTLAAFENEMINNRFATYLVAEDKERIIGYCGTWVILDDSHITNIALLDEYRGQRIGETLLRKAMKLAKMKKAKTMSLEVRVSNEKAKHLYRKLGFQKGGIRKHYYSDNHEDALVMWVNL
ncbi:ribosomal protein S18-alanine N-acetyltransferase [Tuberibacillus sp. Marseille-P3662]|uniref:ribosomal protein S18-alanine N-acetyltransferase n=1 Tax=Tuberibacillus sp. Marseille-P3662 TaxID=1965358 RepID=UPI000A1CD438|nr:ribosomal protein S18-alanine N-acetyltransferase [Tuberibacillus sp. Marseille-P3662]